MMFQKKRASIIERKLKRDSSLLSALINGHVNINSLKDDNSYIIEIICENSFAHYRNETFRNSGINNLINNQDYFAVLNKMTNGDN